MLIRRFLNIADLGSEMRLQVIIVVRKLRKLDFINIIRGLIMITFEL